MRIKLTNADRRGGPIWVETSTIAMLTTEQRRVTGVDGNYWRYEHRRTRITFCGGRGCYVVETPEQIDAVEAGAR